MCQWMGNWLHAPVFWCANARPPTSNRCALTCRATLTLSLAIAKIGQQHKNVARNTRAARATPALPRTQHDTPTRLMPGTPPRGGRLHSHFCHINTKTSITGLKSVVLDTNALSGQVVGDNNSVQASPNVIG